MSALRVRLESADRRTRRAIPAVNLGWDFLDRFKTRNGSVLVGHIAYRLFIWLAPLLLVFSAGLGFSSSTFDLVKYAQDFGVPPGMAQDAIEQTERRQVVALVVGLPALAIASWSLLRGMHYAYAQAWGLEIESRKHAVRHAFVTVVVAIAVCMLMALISLVQRQGPLFAGIGWLGSLLLAFAALWAIQGVMPRKATRWRDLIPGPLIGALGLSALHVFAAVYLPGKMASASVVYGVFGVVFAALFYVFLVAYLIVLVPFVNTVWVDREEILQGRPWVLDPAVLPEAFRGPAARLTRRPKLPNDAPEDGH